MSAPLGGAPSPLPPSFSRASSLTDRISPERQAPVIDRSKVDPKTLAAAEGMEAMFLDYMLKVMRETVPKGEMDLESPATRIYRGMLDSEYASKAARAGGIGLADQIIAYLDSRRYTLPEGQRGSHPPAGAAARSAGPDPVATRSTGGTHESQPFRK